MVDARAYEESGGRGGKVQWWEWFCEFWCWVKIGKEESEGDGVDWERWVLGVTELGFVGLVGLGRQGNNRERGGAVASEFLF